MECLSDTESAMTPSEASEKLKTTRVLHSDFFVTTFCGKDELEEVCLDKACLHMIRLHRKPERLS